MQTYGLDQSLRRPGNTFQMRLDLVAAFFADYIPLDYSSLQNLLHLLTVIALRLARSYWT